MGSTLQGFFIFILLAFVVAVSYYLRSPSFKGSVGEARVNSRLRSTLNQQEYKILKDLTLPTNGGTTQVDHVVVSPYGIFVIETKNMKGWIFGAFDQARWTVVLHRHKSQFQNPLRQNYKHIKVIQELLGVEMRHLHNLVVFVGSAEPKTAMPENVLWSERQLSHHVKSKQKAFFTEKEVRSFAERLEKNALESSRRTQRDHVRHVKARAAERKNDTTKCPRCSAKMVERANKKTGENFLGCSRYPKCKGTRMLS